MLDSMRDALDVDSSPHTHPVSVEVRNPAEINEIVDKITYHKVFKSKQIQFSYMNLALKLCCQNRRRYSTYISLFTSREKTYSVLDNQK